MASTNGEVAELFCRDRLGGAAVDMGFERGLVLDQVTDWVTDNADQQGCIRRSSESRPQETNSLWQRVSKWIRSACAWQRDKCLLRAAREKRLLRADMEQTSGEKPVLLTGSPMCQTFCDLIMVMWNVNAVSEVEYDNLVERCV